MIPINPDLIKKIGQIGLMSKKPKSKNNPFGVSMEDYEPQPINPMSAIGGVANMLGQMGPGTSSVSESIAKTNQNIAASNAAPREGALGFQRAQVNADLSKANKIEGTSKAIGNTLSAVGSAFGPIGALVGGVLGAGVSLIGGGKARREAQKAEQIAKGKAAMETSSAFQSQSENAMRMLNESQQRDSRNVNSPYNLTTKYVSGIAKYGGKLPKYQMGGELEAIEGGMGMPLNQDDQMLMGNSHEQGGIPMADGMGNPVLEAEGGETVRGEEDGSFIYTDSMINPETGNTFAQDSAKIMAKIGKAERKLEKKKNKLDISHDRRIENEIKIYETALDNLTNIQEFIKQNIMASQQESQQVPEPALENQEEIPQEMPQEMDMGMQQMGMMKFGGKAKLPKYNAGGAVKLVNGVWYDEDGKPVRVANKQELDKTEQNLAGQGYSTSRQATEKGERLTGEKSVNVQATSPGNWASRDQWIRNIDKAVKENDFDFLSRAYKGTSDRSIFDGHPGLIDKINNHLKQEFFYESDPPTTTPEPDKDPDPKKTPEPEGEPEKTPTPKEPPPALKLRQAQRFSALPYAATALGTLALSKRIQEPLMRQQAAIRATGVNYDADRTNIDRSLQGVTSGLDQSSSNSAANNANRAGLMAEALKAAGSVNQNEANTNAQIFNQALAQNAAIDGANTDRWNQHQQTVTAIRNDKNFTIPTTVINKFAENLMGVNRDNLAARMSNDQLNLVAMQMYNNADDDGKKLMAQTWNPYADSTARKKGIDIKGFLNKATEGEGLGLLSKTRNPQNEGLMALDTDPVAKDGLKSINTSITNRVVANKEKAASFGLSKLEDVSEPGDLYSKSKETSMSARLSSDFSQGNNAYEDLLKKRKPIKGSYLGGNHFKYGGKKMKTKALI